MKFKQICYVWFVVLLFCLGLVACGGIGMMMPSQSAADQSFLRLTKPLSSSSFVDGAMIVGRSLDFQVSNVDRRNNIIHFSYGSGIASVALIGKSVSTFVQLALQNDGQTIDITVNHHGNFGEGTQAGVEKTISDWKEGLTKQFDKYLN